MNFELLLNEGENIKKLSPDVLIDIKDYRYMINNKLPHTVKFKNIRSYIITTDGRTFWQLSEQYLDSSFRAIGCLEPGLPFIDWILEKQ
jgi:hypothetical protein